MYLRSTSQTRKDGHVVRYLQLAHNVWDAEKGRSETKVLYNFGREQADTRETLPPLLDRPVERVAILGNAGGTTARAFGLYYPEVSIDGVEIDPAVNEVAARYFGLGDNPRLNVITADARPFLRAAEEKYDLIFIDAYRQPYVPFYLATADFFALCRERLKPGGIVALNISTVPGDDRLPHGIAGTLATQFPLVMKWPALRFNQLVLGFSQGQDLSVLAQRAAAAPAEILPLTELLTAQWTAVPPLDDYWTDDRAPVRRSAADPPPSPRLKKKCLHMAF